MSDLRFGTFILPVHPLHESPALALQRDMGLIRHLDALGYDEAWIGEHHSGGAEIIASPELIIAAVAPQTRRIRLGTGVNSLPYHHPLILADRIMQLHNMTEGRTMFGAGPGALVSDARMMGIVTERQRDMMEEALDCIIRLLRGETVTYKADWFELVDAVLQLTPFGGQPIDVVTATMVSPSGPRAAGKFGTGLLSLSATAPAALAAAAGNWQIVTDMAARHGQQAERASWRMVAMCHVAATREQAMADVSHGIDEWLDYFENIANVPMVPPERRTDPVAFLRDNGLAVIGTPDDCAAQIETLERASGGFGCYLVSDNNWAPYDRKLNSYEMIARYVAPRFQGQNRGRQASNDLLRSRQVDYKAASKAATQIHIDRHKAETGPT